MNHEQLTNNGEVVDINRSIAELLPRYYEAYGDNPSYEIEESMKLDGHEVAWMRYSGEVTYDITGQGREGESYEGHSLHCACHFTEGVGWRMDERGPVGLIDGDRCEKKEEVVALQALKLHDAYQEAGMLDDLDDEGIKAVLLDLIEKHKSGIFLEGSSGAEFWGGHYYLQTAAEILGIPMKEIWSSVDQLKAEKKIRLEGMVVQEYHEPPKVEKYETDDVPESTIHYEKSDKVWALVPQPGQNIDLEGAPIDDSNRWSVMGNCILGLANEPDLAKRRLEEAIANPRISYERLYQMSFVEPAYKTGVLAVVAYTARYSSQPEEWVVEGFLGDAVVPEVHTLPMSHSTMFGVDVEDQDRLNKKIEEWWPED